MIKKNFFYYLFTIISWIFHPVFMTTTGLFILITEETYSAFYSQNEINYIVGYIFLITVIIPLISILLAKFFNIIKSYDFNSPNDRIVTITIYTFCLFISLNIASRIPLDNYIILFLGVSSVTSLFSLLTCLIKNFKISLHMIGIGGITGLLFCLSLVSIVDFTILIFISVLLSGLIGTARLYLQKHNSIEVYGGYSLGFLAMFISYYFYLC